MINHAPSTTVLLFSRSAQAEAEVKSFGVSKAAAIRIHEQLQLQIERTIVLSGLPLIKSTEATQRGNTFGQRLANAISDCFSKGLDKLIIVGGDTPELTATDIISAHIALKQGRPTLGKDFRGGSFLIGLSKDSFRQNHFAELPWQTASIACALKKELGLQCNGDVTEVFELGQRADCNTRQDLVNLAKRSTCNDWTILLNTTTRRIYDNGSTQALVYRFGESLTRRGPPNVLQQAA